jgi:hypothetical protein
MFITCKASYEHGFFFFVAPNFRASPIAVARKQLAGQNLDEVSKSESGFFFLKDFVM